MRSVRFLNVILTPSLRSVFDELVAITGRTLRETYFGRRPNIGIASTSNAKVLDPGFMASQTISFDESSAALVVEERPMTDGWFVNRLKRPM
jgi:hypothetical protein